MIAQNILCFENFPFRRKKNFDTRINYKINVLGFEMSLDMKYLDIV